MSSRRKIQARRKGQAHRAAALERQVDYYRNRLADLERRTRGVENEVLVTATILDPVALHYLAPEQKEWVVTREKQALEDKLLEAARGFMRFSTHPNEKRIEAELIVGRRR